MTAKGRRFLSFSVFKPQEKCEIRNQQRNCLNLMVRVENWYKLCRFGIL